MAGLGSLRAWFRQLQSAEASQLLEFAVALPLLVVFVVGIFDFGDAFNLKQKLNTAVRDGARRASTLPTDDLANPGTPVTVNVVRDVVDHYLQGSRINDCGLDTQAGVTGANPMTWTYTASGNGCAGTLILTVERGYSYPAVIDANTFHVVSSRITIQYPYKWHFNSVITLLVPGANYAGTTTITTSAIAPNMD